MSLAEQDTFIHRLGRMFRWSAKTNGNGHASKPLVERTIVTEPAEPVQATEPIEPDESAELEETREEIREETRPVLFQPWSRQSPIQKIEAGFQSLTELMTVIRQNMEAQGARQEQLLTHLAALPKVLETIPQSNQLHGETLTAIKEQIIGQVEHQRTLGEILGKLNDSNSDQKDLIRGLTQQVDSVQRHENAMADSLGTVSTAMQSASRNSAASAEVLMTLRDTLQWRDRQLEGVLLRQGNRFNKMMTAAIVLSVVSLLTAIGAGWALWAHALGL